MNKTLATIGTASLILGSLTLAHARDTITRKEFEQAAHQLEIGVEQGKISKQDARAGIEALRKATADQDHGEPKPDARDQEPNPREVHARAEAELKQAVKDGKISEQDAKARLKALRKRLSDNQEQADPDAKKNPQEHPEQDIAKAIGERLKQLGGQLKQAVANGDMTDEEAWTKWREVKKTKVAPHLEAAVKQGKLSEQDAKAIWHGIERAETAEKLKAAVAAGKLSEEDARAKWEEYQQNK